MNSLDMAEHLFPCGLRIWTSRPLNLFLILSINMLIAKFLDIQICLIVITKAYVNGMAEGSTEGSWPALKTS